MELQWEEPPAPKAGRTRSAEMDAIVEELKKYPGSWVRITQNAAPAGAAWKQRGCDVQTVSAGRGYVRGKCDTYVRWPAPWDKKQETPTLDDVKAQLSHPGDRGRETFTKPVDRDSPF